MTIATIFALHRRNKQDRFIIVCPSSLVVNWSKEFDKWIGKASQPCRVVVRKGGDEAMQQIKTFVPLKPNKSEVLILSYDMFRMHSEALSNCANIGCLVVDEGHRLKNTSGSFTLSALNSLSCEARILITGTPIQNNLSEFYNIVEFVNPGILGDLQSFRRGKFHFRRHCFCLAIVSFQTFLVFHGHRIFMSCFCAPLFSFVLFLFHRIRKTDNCSNQQTSDGRAESLR